jgi:hypothetical protein
MPLETLIPHYSEANNQKLSKKYEYLQRLLSILEERDFQEETIVEINAIIVKMNMKQSDAKIQRKALSRQQTVLLRTIEKREKLVVRNHYRNTWLALGMSVFGIPIGVIIGNSMDNMSFLGYGLSIGMIIGLVFGMVKDKAAAKENRQLDIELQP